jgi:hypothetical protein
MDINALGKFLIKNEPQDHPTNKLILEILDRISHVGNYYGEQDKNVLSKHSFNVRYAYFDHTRNLVDAIPEPLLVRLMDRTGVHPEEDYADLVSKRRQRKRDIYGRFMKESPVPPTIEAGPPPIAELQSTGTAAVVGTETITEKKPIKKQKSLSPAGKSRKKGLTKPPKK